ncbi:MAG: SAP domain-containing protein [Minisyncoccia bacterium]|jgi:hypothetical protein
MFHKDTNFIISVQLTLIGIVLMIGLYLLWKGLSRVEEKIDIILQSGKTELRVLEKPQYSFINQDELEESIDNDTFMNNIFNSDIMFEDTDEGDNNNNQDDTVKIEEVSTYTNNKNDDEESVSMSVKNEYTKTKLRQMTVDKLKELCDKSGISSEGTKNQMIDRLLSAE